MSAKEYERKTEEFITPILERKGLSLWDVVFEKQGKEYYLTAYIDKPGGVTVDDCEEVSREMNEILDREDYIRENYTFVVSSPGLDRPLKRERDFINSIGREVEIKTYKAIDGTKEFTGVLKAYDQDTVTVDEGGGDRVFDRKDIAMIRLAFEI
ncbi:MAG: ribosome maturation factor RimP [Lachnospiraceae bacterium]|uniref:Ribosome maturation factor RimP n=1 Tax=Candidatus Weimeria bifida TaxID=2599074 RepID=A0A6N7IXC2_9FIRM|nr:ribosome maturation factor RimP [Candidatus Weimeria bifida]RRF96035.1 MAG: ribosome maturation factor RimP [Lachnospiraceae bacterium]